MSKRFIVDEKDLKKIGNDISIYGDEAHHINVLRHRVKDNIYCEFVFFVALILIL